MEAVRTEPGVTLGRILEPVRRYWGFERLLFLQEEAIRAELADRNSVVVLPTGGGKSLCYQVPPVLTGRTGVVIMPLMKDQVDGLRACGYPAATVHSGMSPDERELAIQGLVAGEYRLVFRVVAAEPTIRVVRVGSGSDTPEKRDLQGDESDGAVY